MSSMVDHKAMQACAITEYVRDHLKNSLPAHREQFTLRCIDAGVTMGRVKNFILKDGHLTIGEIELILNKCGSSLEGVASEFGRIKGAATKRWIENYTSNGEAA